MHGLEALHLINDVRPAAEAHLKRYAKLCRAAIKRENWGKARHYDGLTQDFRRFLSGEIKVFPNRSNKEKGKFIPSRGRDFAKLPDYMRVV